MSKNKIKNSKEETSDHDEKLQDNSNDQTSETGKKLGLTKINGTPRFIKINNLNKK